MAEYVHQTLEEMLPELEEMSTLGLFTNKETKIILKNRENHEYRLRQLTKTKPSFLNYVEYEKKILELLKIRRKKSGSDSKKRNIEKSIADRIHQLYRLVTTRFQDDVSLWVAHIDFSKALTEKAYVTRLYERCLKLHSHNEALWVASAQWEASIEGNNNHDLAREILLKAHRVMPDSQTIFLELYQMELQLAQVILKRKAILGLDEAQDKQNDNVVELKLAEILYRKGLEIFPGFSDFHLKILGITCKIKEAGGLEAKVIEDLQRVYPSRPEVWNGLALINMNNVKKATIDEKKLALTQCMDMFNKAVTEVPTEHMYSLTIASHLALLDVKELSSFREHILHTTLELFQRAVSLRTLSEPLFVEFLALLNGLALTEDADAVAGVAVVHHPASCPLWSARLQHMSQADAIDDAALVKALLTATKKVPQEKAWPMWMLTLNVLGANQSDELEGLMERACRSSTPQVCKPAKEWSLNYTLTHGGIKKMRAAWQVMKVMQPTSLGLYRIYIKAECAQETVNLKLVRAAFEEALCEFGLTEPGLWLNYMEMERTVAQEASRSGVIEGRALSGGLDLHYREAFVRKQVMMGTQGFSTHHQREL